MSVDVEKALRELSDPDDMKPSTVPVPLFPGDFVVVSPPNQGVIEYEVYPIGTQITVALFAIAATSALITGVLGLLGGGLALGFA